MTRSYALRVSSTPASRCGMTDLIAPARRFKPTSISITLVVLLEMDVVLVRYAFQSSLMLSGENNGEF